MQLRVLRLLLDFGLVVLIWMVQLVIYPSFEHFEPENLFTWHASYMQRITFVVLPLMVGQGLIALLQLYRRLSFYSIGSFVLILVVWVLTFSIFVPLHSAVSSSNFSTETLEVLVSQNWWRTAVWNVLLLISLTQFSKFKPFES